MLTDGGHDEDRDGAPDTDEYGCDTDPRSKTDLLKIMSVAATPGTNTLTWTCRPTRLYRVTASNALPTAPAGAWEDVGGGLLGPPATPTAQADIPDPGVTSRFYRVHAVMPLSE
jgi:hypothetical protein